MAGYFGFSKSNNAVEAERNGRYPLTKATTVLASIMGISKAEAKNLLKEEGPTEYHHTSKMYNCTDYYSVDSALATLAEAGNQKAFEALVERGNYYREGCAPTWETVCERGWL